MIKAIVLGIIVVILAVLIFVFGRSPAAEAPIESAGGSESGFTTLPAPTE